MESFLAELEEAFAFQCNICCSRLDDRQHLPLMVCPEQHVYCKTCVNIHFASNSQNSTQRLHAVCPECRTEVAREKIKEFRIFRKIFKFYNRMKAYLEEERINRDQKAAQVEEANKIAAITLKDEIEEDYGKLARGAIPPLELEKAVKALKEKQEKYHIISIEKLTDVIESEVKDLEEMTDGAIRTANYSLAIFAFKKIIQYYPSKKYTFLGLGNKENHNGFYQDQISHWYQSNLKSIQHRFSPYDLLSLCISQSANMESHRKWYKIMLNRAPNPELIFGLANLQYNLGNYGAARDLYLKTFELMPGCSPIYINIAFTYYRERKIKEARHFAFEANKNHKYNLLAEFIFAVTEEKLLDQIDSLEEIIQIEEKYARGYCAIGRSYMELGRPNDAVKYLQKSIEIAPSYVKPRFLLGKLFYSILNFKEAKTHLEECIKMSPRHSKAYCYLGNICFKTCDYDTAIVFYQKDIEVCQRTSRSYQNLVLVYQQKRQYDKCMQYLRKGHQKYPSERKEWLILLGNTYLSFQKYMPAIKAYLQCLAEGGCEDTLVPLIIQVCCECNNIRDAIAYAQMWKGRKTDSPLPDKYLKELYPMVNNSIPEKGWQPEKRAKC